MPWPIQKYVWEGMREKHHKFLMACVPAEIQTGALASLGGLSETMKQVKRYPPGFKLGSSRIQLNICTATLACSESDSMLFDRNSYTTTPVDTVF